MKTGFELLGRCIPEQGNRIYGIGKKKTWIGGVASALCGRYRNAGTAYLPPNGKKNFFD